MSRTLNAALCAVLLSALLVAGRAVADSSEARDTTGACQRMFLTASGERIQFRQDTATVRRASYAALERLAEVLHDCPDLRVRISGHTDSVGDAAYNLQLGERRAQAVAARLAASGIRRDRLQVRAAGAAEPLADNTTAYGRSLNRRIEFELLAAE